VDDESVAEVSTGYSEGVKTMKKTGEHRAARDTILSMVRQGPCTIRQLADACATSNYEVVKYLADLVRRGEIAIKSGDNPLLVVSASPLIRKRRPRRKQVFG
jgi:hypothetical protein